MTTPITIYHNPRCSKSRQTLALLQQQGFEPLVIEYLKNPPSAEELTRLLSWLELRPRQLIRSKEEMFERLSLHDASDADLIAAMVNHPKLIERPIVAYKNRAVLGRPPEKVLELIHE